MIAAQLKNECPAAAFEGHSEQPTVGQVQFEYRADAERASLVWGEGVDQYRVTFIELDMPKNAVLIEIGTTTSIHSVDVARDYWMRLSQSGYRMELAAGPDTNR